MKSIVARDYRRSAVRLLKGRSEARHAGHPRHAGDPRRAFALPARDGDEIGAAGEQRLDLALAYDIGPLGLRLLAREPQLEEFPALLELLVAALLQLRLF